MVLLWVWFLWIVLQNHFVVEMVYVSCTPKPLDVLNGFLWSNMVHITIKNKKHMKFSNHNRTFSKPSDSGTNFEFLATESQFSEKFPIWFRQFLKPSPSSIFPNSNQSLIPPTHYSQFSSSSTSSFHNQRRPFSSKNQECKGTWKSPANFITKPIKPIIYM